MIQAALTVAIFISLSAALYLVPVIVAVARHAPDIGAIAVINILLGWTFVGWVLALALAMRSVNPPGPTVQLVQNMPRGDWAELTSGNQPWQAPQLMLPPPADAAGPAGWEGEA